MAAGRLSVKTGGKGDAGGHSEYIDDVDVDAPAPNPWARVSKPKRDDIVARGSGNMPRWAITPALFWSASDEYERVGGTTYREMEIMLPRELRPAQRLALLAEWIEQELGSKHAYQYAVHCPLALDGEEQPHVHLMFSERQVDGIERDPDTYFKRQNAKNPERGGCKKGWGPRAGETLTYDERRAELVALRTRWEVMCNAHLAAAGVEARIDMRSYAARGLLDEGMGPERKLSPIEARSPEVIADLLDYRAARQEYQEAKAAADVVVARYSGGGRPRAVPVPVRPDRSARELERLLAQGEQKLAEREAQVIQLPPPAEPAEPAPVSGPTADVVPIRPEPPPAPEIRAAAYEFAARAYLVPGPSPAPTTARAPAEQAEPAPVARRDIATVPAPLPAVRTVRDVDDAIAEAEARLQALEQRERARATAAEAYRRAQAALQTAQAGLWARLRAWAGFSAPKPVLEAQSAAQAAAEVARRQGLLGSFGALLVPPGGAAERVELQRQLTALRDERGGLVAETAAAERRTLVAIDQVIALVQRADLVVTAEMRPEWRALRALDAAGGLAGLRDRLTRDPGMAVALAHDLGVRRPEIERMERTTGAAIEQSRVVLVPSPDLGRAQASASDNSPQGLLAAVEDGPAQAWPQHWYAYIALCEQRGQITAADRELVADWLTQQPPVRLARDSVAEYVRAQGEDDRADYGAPTL